MGRHVKLSSYRHSKKVYMKRVYWAKRSAAECANVERASTEARTEESIQRKNDRLDFLRSSTDTLNPSQSCQDTNDEVVETPESKFAGERTSNSSTSDRSIDLSCNNKIIESPNSKISIASTSRKRPATNENSDCQMIDGRRIVDVAYFFDQIVNFPHHQLFSCSANMIKIQKELRKGLSSTFILRCDGCCVTHRIYSENQANKKMNINSSAILGTVNIGIGRLQLTNFLAAINIPWISQRMYQEFEDGLLEYFEESAFDLMIQAGIEESKIAIESGNIDTDGIPKITVLADGAWSKRSYKNNYNANSGVACIVGYATKKILYIGVRNKYCAACHLSDKEHKCYKNWTGSSTGMESSIIVDGFKNSLDMHNLKYEFLVGDGDSSVYKRILEANPYRGLIVKKIECKNHLLRNFCNKLRELTQKRLSSSGTNVPPKLRNELKSNILRFRVGVESAIKYYRNSNFPHNKKIYYLKEDLGNSSFHIFGQHEKCKEYFCCKKTDTSTNSIPAMMQCGLLDDILGCINRLKFHAESLIKNLNTNHAEYYNSLVAKFVGGKRVNFSRRGSYGGRCFAAVSCMNSKGNQLETIHKKITGRSPGKHTITFLKQQGKIRAKKRLKKRIIFSNKQQDADYGDNADKPNIEIDEKKMENIKIQILNKLKTALPEEIFESTKNQALTQTWHEERKKRITSSNFGKIFNLRATTDKGKVAKTICNPTFKGNRYTEYGIANEPKAIEAMETLIKKKIKKSGLFVNKDYYFLAASPDGLIEHDGLVEIKCPFVARDLSPEEAILSKKIKFASLENGELRINKRHMYYFQIQGQLFISQREYCNFCIWTPKGCMFQIIKKDEELWHRMLVKLKEFYFAFYLPELIRQEYL